MAGVKNKVAAGLAVWSVAWLMAPAVAAAQTAPDEAALDWLAIPLMKFNDDAGFVYGVKLEMVKAAAKGSLEPHDWNLTMKLLHSTTNRHEHRVEYDLPGAFGSPWRLVVRLDVLHIDDAAYFGIGNGTVDRGKPAFHSYQLTEPRLRVLAKRRVWGEIYLGAGVVANVTVVDAEPGSQLQVEGPPGEEGGAALAPLMVAGYDSRDDELVPTRGGIFELYLKGAHELALSETSFYAIGARGQLYLSPWGPWLVLAQRAMVERQGGDVPFYELQRMGGGRDFRALGGVFSQRGYVEGRFAGSTKLLSNSEVRVYAPPVLEKLFLGVGAFGDLSRVVEAGEAFQDGWHPSGGGSAYINWADAFLFRMDYGVSDEGGLFYIEGRHLF